MASNDFEAMLHRGWAVSPAAMRREANLARLSQARADLPQPARIAFYCECEDDLCSAMVVLNLDEYEARLDNAVVSPAHADRDPRRLIERTERFCTVSDDGGG
jgi:hypothetical protein